MIVVLAFVAGTFAQVNYCNGIEENGACGNDGGKCQADGQCGPPNDQCRRISATIHDEAPEWRSGSLKRTIDENDVATNNIHLVFEVSCVFDGVPVGDTGTTVAGTNQFRVQGGAALADTIPLGMFRECGAHTNCIAGSFCANKCLYAGDQCGNDGETIALNAPGQPGYCADVLLCDANNSIDQQCATMGSQNALSAAAKDVLHIQTWAPLATYAADPVNALMRDATTFTEYTIVIEFQGKTNHLWDYQHAKPITDVQREVNEIYTMTVAFQKTVTVDQGIVSTYSVITYVAMLEATIARIDNGLDLEVNFIVRTLTDAPFVLDYTATGIQSSHSLVENIGGQIHVLQFIEEYGDRDANCYGPYVASGGVVGVSTTIGEPCSQRWHFRTTIDLTTTCKITGATLQFGDPNGASCGAIGNGLTDNGYVCPITASTNDFLTDVVVKTADGCTSFTLSTNACGYMQIRDGAGNVKVGDFSMGDTFEIHTWVGAALADANGASTDSTSQTGILAATNNIVIAPAVGHCVGGSCTPTVAPFDSQGCSANHINLSNVADHATKVADAVDHKTCPDSMYDCWAIAVDSFRSADYDLALPNGTPVTITFTNTIDVTMSNDLKKSSRISVSTRDQFYALLQEGEEAEIRSTASAGMMAAPAAPEQVEEAQAAPETGVQEDLALAETSSNLVYIVVGVLLVLSIAIAAVVMYMRRVKGAKKVQPVVPLPITIETTSASSTA